MKMWTSCHERLKYEKSENSFKWIKIVLIFPPKTISGTGIKWEGEAASKGLEQHRQQEALTLRLWPRTAKHKTSANLLPANKCFHCLTKTCIEFRRWLECSKVIDDNFGPLLCLCFLYVSVAAPYSDCKPPALGRIPPEICTIPVNQVTLLYIPHNLCHLFRIIKHIPGDWPVIMLKNHIVYKFPKPWEGNK